MYDAGIVNRSDINTVVLVGVLKDARDLGLLLREKWYRVPVKDAPTRTFTHLAFYQPAVFGRQGKCIRYYARVVGTRRAKRRTLLPDEPDHPRAREWYYQFQLERVRRLPRPIRNITPRRVTFGFTTLHRLRTARDILQLYGVVPTEQMIADALQQEKIRMVPQHYIRDGAKRYFADLAIFCIRGKIAIECDNAKAHSGLWQREKDEKKDAALQRLGWAVVRLTEEEITSDLRGCLMRITKAIRYLGGQ